MGLFDKLKKETEDRKVEWLTFKEADWTKAREIIFVNGRHVDLVKDQTEIHDEKVTTFTVMVDLTREEAVDMYARLLASGIKEFKDNSKGNENR